MLIQEAVKQLQSLSSFLKQLKGNDYKLNVTTLKNSSIGKHVRHILEFYKSLLFTCHGNRVNYDNRERNLVLEQDLKFTLEYIDTIIDALNQISLDKPLQLSSTYNGTTYHVETSLHREIAFNIEHTTHHLAIISMAIPIHFEYIKLSETFGYAESTIQHIKSQEILK